MKRFNTRAASGAMLNTALVKGLEDPDGLAVSGSRLFVAKYDPTDNNTISEYSTSGATVSDNLIKDPRLLNVQGIAASGSDLFITYFSLVGRSNGMMNYAGTIGEYTTSGAIVNDALASGLPSDPQGICVESSGSTAQSSGSSGLVPTFGNVAFPAQATVGAKLNAKVPVGRLVRDTAAAAWPVADATAASDAE